MRLKRGFTQDQMAERMCLNRSTISRMENGKITVTLRDAMIWSQKTSNQDLLLSFIANADVIGDSITSLPTVVSLALPFIA